MTMHQPPPMPLQRMNAQDEAHLGLISVFHFVLAGLCSLGIAFLIIHYAIMSMVIKAAGEQHAREHSTPAAVSPTPTEISPDGTEITPTPPAYSPPSRPPAAPFPKEIMPILIGFYLIGGLFILSVCAANILSGLFIRKRKHRTFSYIVAGVNCMQFPFGTALGVFTFIVLSRISVKMEYDSKLAD